MFTIFFFFFSSRRRHTRSTRDWSSDVCSSDLEQLTEKYPPGTVVKGKVRNIADFGIFVEIEEGIDGLVHISDMSWTQRIKHPSEMYQKGDEVEAVVLNIDTQDGEKPKISLGVKQLIADPWDRIPFDYPVGKVHD